MIYLYGASGHAKVILEILEKQGADIGGLIDNNPSIKGLLNYPVITALDETTSNNAEIIIGIGDNLIRKKVAESIQANFVNAIHSSANISPRCTLGAGTVIMAGVSVNTSVKIGKHVILNTNCSIDHDCVINDFVHVSPNVALAGNVFVDECAHIGIGASVIQGVKIGKWAVIGAGAVIIRDVPDYAVVVGNPGKVIKSNQKDIDSMSDSIDKDHIGLP
jgi:sugar O-acyltransferase (sialic acid O-acetyltransferase NeuD family)